MHHILSREKAYRYRGCCVHLDGDLIGDMVDAAIDITYQTFRRNIGAANCDELSEHLGYTRMNLRLADDYHVSFHRSKFEGRRCYYCRHSAIEYIFILEDE